MVSLEEVQEQHLEKIRNWRNSHAVSQYMYTNDHITEAQQRNWYASIQNNESCKYWIIKYEAIAVGLVSITNIDRKNNKCFWAFYIGEEEFLGSGIGAKVEFLALEYAYFELGMNKVACEVLESNAKVIGLHKRFGFTEEAFYKQHIRKEEQYENVVGLAMLKAEWQVKRDYFIKTLKFKI